MDSTIKLEGNSQQIIFLIHLLAKFNKLLEPQLQPRSYKISQLPALQDTSL